MYSWTWSWGTPVKDSGAKTDILGIVAASTEKTAQFKALGKNGSGDVIATANVNGYNNFPSAVVSGHVAEVAFLCENPWPALDAKKANGSLYGIPFIENAENTNFSLFYCRDIGKPEEIQNIFPRWLGLKRKDLPEHQKRRSSMVTKLYKQALRFMPLRQIVTVRVFMRIFTSSPLMQTQEKKLKKFSITSFRTSA